MKIYNTITISMILQTNKSKMNQLKESLSTFYDNVLTVKFLFFFDDFLMYFLERIKIVKKL